MGAVRIAAIRESELSVDEVMRAVSAPGVGGIALFVGTVRDNAGEDAEQSSSGVGAPVTGLSYSAHPTAERVLRQVAEQVSARHPDVALAATHRVGDLRVGDIAVAVAAGAGHRGDAFAACRAFIDQLKREVPIWKLEHFVDGKHVWVGL